MDDENYNLEDTLFHSSIPFLVIGLIGNVLVIRIVHKKREIHTQRVVWGFRGCCLDLLISAYQCNQT